MDWIPLLLNITVTGILLYVFQKVIDERAAKRLEEFKANLQLTTVEHETRFSRLHTDRAKVIAEFYKRLSKVERSLSLSAQGIHLHADLEQPWEKAVDESRKSFENTLDNVSQFEEYFQENRIFLSNPLCEKIEFLLQEIFAALSDLEGSFAPTPPNTQGPGPAILSLWQATKKVEVTIPSIKRDIEKEFKNILGVEK